MFIERTSFGLDVHARSVVAAAIDGVTGEVFRARLVPDAQEVIGWIAGLPGPCAAVYETGPTGFGLARAVRAAGVRCEVAAASKIVRPAGDRVKTDARDALLLARLLRLDEVVPVRVPTEVEESARDLVRCREAARADLMRAPAPALETVAAARDRVLRRQGLDRRSRHLAAAAVVSAGRDPGRVRGRLRDRRAHHRAPGPPGRHDHGDGRGQPVHPGGAPPVLPARDRHPDRVLPGGEIGDWERFTGAGIGAYLGLVPSEHSSEPSRSQGSITKTGNSHVRRMLVEAAWHHRRPYRPTAILRRRWELAPPAAVARAQAGNHRLHQRWVTYAEHKKRPVIANVAVARELAGWCWSLAMLPD